MVTPPPEILYRIANKPLAAISYHQIGKRSVADIAMALAQAGRQLESLKRILDFGIGCGRVAQYLKQLTPEAVFHGTDVDKPMIDWCSRYLIGVEATVNSSLPPLELPEASFDLIYAISVFTHLDADRQRVWLAELGRLLAPGGMLYVTFHGMSLATEFARSFTPKERATLDQQGFIFIVNIGDKIQPDWYQTSFQSIEFICAALPSELEFVAHRPRGHADFQDSVLCRKPAGGHLRPPPRAVAEARIAQHCPWMFEHWDESDGRFSASGWLFVRSLDSSAPRFRINGESANPAEHLSPAADVAARFPHLPSAGFYRFSLRGDAIYPGGFLGLDFLTEEDSVPGPGTSWFVPDPAREPALPSASNLYRVIGSDSAWAFRVGGATLVRRYDAWAKAKLDQGLAEMGAVLDWGCGCGRVTRYLPALGCRDIIGCDVDSFNLQWCLRHLPGITFHQTELTPPLPYRDEQFGLIIGTSVLTHMDVKSQDAWLDEIARVLRPGGIAMLTFMAEAYVTLVGGEDVLLAAIAEEGIVTRHGNDQLHLGGPENAYVNTYHSQEYVRHHWIRGMELLAIADFLGTHHDTAILRRE